jgi:hypothetical protein
MTIFEGVRVIKLYDLFAVQLSSKIIGPAVCNAPHAKRIQLSPKESRSH